MHAIPVARGLGWFSIGLGLAEVQAGRPLSAFLGTKHTGLVQAFGVRELTAGVGILAPEQPRTPWLWARIGGDALDVAALVVTYQNIASTRKAVGFSLANVIAIAALDIWCALRVKSLNLTACYEVPYYTKRSPDGRRQGKPRSAWIGIQPY